MNLSRRHFLLRLGCAGAALATGSVGYAWAVEPHRVQVTRHRLTVPGLPPRWQGVTIAHLTDLHRSRYVSAEYLAACVARTNALQPDLIMITGDYLTHARNARGRAVYGEELTGEQLTADCAAILGKARARFGMFASLGNHDHWFNAAVVTRHLESVGIPVLRNAHQPVRINGELLPVVGLGDLWTEGVDTERAFAGVDAPFAIVLMHNPDTFEHWSRPGAHLILAGHTHGGQINLPLIGPPVVPSRYGAKYAHGLFRRGDTQMYVSRGIGAIYPPVRFNCRPEIALFTLHRPSVRIPT